MIRAGELDQRIDLVEASVSSEGTGEEILDFDAPANTYTVSAKVTFREGTEGDRMSSDSALEAYSQTVFKIRFNDNYGLNAKTFRVEYRGETYNIRSIRPGGRNNREEYIITAESTDLD